MQTIGPGGRKGGAGSPTRFCVKVESTMATTEAEPPLNILWLTGGSCDGCTMSALGGIDPQLEALLLGRITGLRPVQLHHPILAFEAGEAFLADYRRAAEKNPPPFILVVEGSIFDSTAGGAGAFSGMGEETGRPITVTDWLDRLAPAATAIIAVGTCATWGGIPAAAGNPTGAMGLTAYLGAAYRSQADLPIINIPGCAPPGDNFVETLIYLLLHLAQEIPLDLDDWHRPRWMYADTTHLQPAHADYLPEVISRSDLAVPCRVPVQGWMNHVGGCGNIGGACNGCTMPGFPDQMLPLTRIPIQS